MAYILRSLLLVSLLALVSTILLAFSIITIGFSHIILAVPTYLIMLFSQAFIIFYFIGVHRFVKNIYYVLQSQTEEKNDPEALKELFESPPNDLTPYKEKVYKFYSDSLIHRRQTLPWGFLIIILGMLAILLGGAHDTGLVSKTVHQGVVYGLCLAFIIGLYKQWLYLKKAHLLLRKIKFLFEIPDSSM